MLSVSTAVEIGCSIQRVSTTRAATSITNPPTVSSRV
jgi:hypothetical protein